jgi:hypothetical protein
MGLPGRAFSSLESYLKHTRFHLTGFKVRERPFTLILESLNLILVCRHDWQIKENA